MHNASSAKDMIAKRILDGIVRNKYAADPGKLAAWLSASHVESAPKKKAAMNQYPTRFQS